MTLEQEIEKRWALAEENFIDGHLDEAYENEQVAKWLEELKERREKND